MTIGGEWTNVELPASHSDAELICEDPNDPRCAVGAPRGREADRPMTTFSGATTLSSIAWPSFRANTIRREPQDLLRASAGVLARLDRPPRAA
jgi:hypothetical protein